MRISFITTVLNEEYSIGLFLKSLFSQSKKPDEVVIVDGGSSDRTVSKVQSVKLKVKSYPLRSEASNAKFKILIKPGNRSVGRNEGIRQATGEIITVSDVGCILDKNWVKNIIEPFYNSKVDVVAGFYLPISKSVFEKCLATYTCMMPDQVRLGQFLPSSRSVAFKKSVWEKAGGYPEWLDTCEDLYFAQKLKKMGFKFAFAKNAQVYWPQRKNFWQAFCQFYRYAIGDGQTFFTPYSVHRKKIIFLFSRFLLSLILLIYIIFNPSILLFAVYCLLLTVYLLWSILKNYRYINDWRAIFILPALQLTSDIAVLLGTTTGFVRSLFL